MKLIENSIISLWRYKYRSNHFLKKFTGVLGVDILVKASAFILIPLYLRLMSQEEFGLYNYFISIITTFSLILNLGLYVAQSKLFHEFNDERERGAALFTLNIFLLLFLVVFFSIMIVFNVDHDLIKLLIERPIDYSEFRLAFLLSLLVSVFSFMLTNYFYTSEKIKEVKAFNIFRIILINIICLAILYLFKVNSVVTRLLCVCITELFLFLFYVRYLTKEFVPLFDWHLLKKGLKLGLPITLSAVFSLLISFSDKFFLEKYGSLKDLSNYYLAFSFASILPIIFTSFQNVWLPVFLKEKDLKKNIEKTDKLVIRVALFSLLFCSAIWLSFGILLYFGIIPEKYHSALYILPILLASQVLTTITTLYGNFLVYFEKTHFAAIIGFVVSIFSITLGLVLVPRWGVYGAAIGSLGSNIFYLSCYYWWIQKNQQRHVAYS